MPISIEWQPPLAPLAGAAYQAGYGDYLNRQQQVALQQAQMAQQAQLAQQHLAAQLYSQQQSQLDNQASMLFHADQQQRQNEFNKGFEYDRLNWQRDNNVADWQRQREAHVSDIADQRQAQEQSIRLHDQLDAQRQQEQWQRQNEEWWKRNNVQDQEKSIDGTISHVVSNIDLVPDALKPQAQSLYSTWQNIKNDRFKSGAPIEAYQQAMSSFADAFGRSGIVEQMKPRLDLKEQIKNEAHPVPGFGLISRDRSGALRRVAPDPISDFLKSNLKNFTREDENGNTSVDMDAAVEAAHKYAEALDQYYNHQQTGQPIAPRDEKPTSPQLTPEQQQRYAQASADYQKIQAQQSQPQAGGQQVTQVGTAHPTTERPVTLKDLGPERRHVLESLLPHPKTPAEAAKLHPGTDFITPDGRLKTVPGASP